MIDQAPNPSEEASFRDAAQQLLASGSAGDELLRKSGTIPGAFPVRATGGQIHSWFVPVTVNDRLAGFFQFMRDGTLMSFSSFQRRPGDLSGCPPAEDWLDASRIRSRAESQLAADETTAEPFLTYDRSPDRLVWAVPLVNKAGQTRIVYVVGETVYLPPPGGTFG
jgi:hypothetical protein